MYVKASYMNQGCIYVYKKYSKNNNILNIITI